MIVPSESLPSLIERLTFQHVGKTSMREVYGAVVDALPQAIKERDEAVKAAVADMERRVRLKASRRFPHGDMDPVTVEEAYLFTSPTNCTCGGAGTTGVHTIHCEAMSCPIFPAT